VVVSEVGAPAAAGGGARGAGESKMDIEQ
jgi:hypothetical protein